MITCSKCRRTTAKTDGRWGSVLRDEPGASPKILCPSCADEVQNGWAEDIDPVTKQKRRFQRDYQSTLSRF